MKHLNLGLRASFLTATFLAQAAAAVTLEGDTVQYEVRGFGGVFGSGSAVVGPDDEFVVDAAADIGFDDGKISVDISGSSILFWGPTTPNTFRYGHQSIRVFSLDFLPGSVPVGSITVTPQLADPADFYITYGPHDVVFNLGNSLWVHGIGDTVRVDLAPIPEPMTGMLWLAGLVALAATRTVRSTG